ncbi:MAG: pyruvate dehydrogenase complex dihydrolipoamide acetyltransferase [Chlamydiales bacterium]|nr:pyruvate dehydrogenase complex dihydrolipoamide acetyltransferase [Chlamydiales bacterium]
MPSTLTMPKLSPTMEEGTIVKWHKKEGDAVKAGDVLFEVATDKATVEHSALDDGILRKILINENAEAKVNQPVAIFTESADESIEGYQPEGIHSEPKEAAPEKSAEEKPAAAPAPKSGGVVEPGFAPEPPLEDYTFEFSTSPQAKAFASPLAKKLAKEKGLDLTGVKGSGPGGRVMERDLNLAQGGRATFGSTKAPTLAPGTYEEEKLTPMRKAIGARLQASKTFIPHFYIQQEVDARAMVTIRKQLKAMDVHVTFNDFVLRACALALREHPVINSGFNSVDQSIIRFKTIDISVAVTIDEGLITPVIHHADYKNMGQLSAEVKLLASLAKQGKLKPEQYKGGSFTISNLGMTGITNFTAVINPPQAAILAIGGIVDKPIVVPVENLDESQVVPGKVMELCLSCDHRVIDGMDGAKFIKTVQQYLENPAVLLI